MAVYQGSRYIKTSIYNKRNGAIVFSLRKRAKFNLTNATYYTFVQGDTLDGIAYKVYGNAQLWWSILDCNPKYQSEIEIKPGDLLIIPPFVEVVKVSG